MPLMSSPHRAARIPLDKSKTQPHDFIDHGASQRDETPGDGKGIGFHETILHTQKTAPARERIRLSASLIGY